MSHRNLVLIGVLILMIFYVGSSMKKPLTKLLLSNGKMISVTIIKSEGPADQGGSPGTFVFNDKKTIDIFIRAITGAKKYPGVLDIAKPEYTIEILFENDKTKTFYIWLNDNSEQGTLMTAEETGTGYSISKKVTKELKTLLKDAE
ncbi:MAG: hypothetical protein ACYC2T_13195 [Bacillota bacterium]